MFWRNATIAEKLAEATVEQNWPRVMEILDNTKTQTHVKEIMDTIKRSNNEGFLLLAAIHDAPVELLGKIIMMNPKCVVARDEVTGRLPLHILASGGNKFSFEALVLICESFPEALIMQDYEEEQTPLHIVCSAAQGAVSLRRVEYLLDRWPEATLMEDWSCMTPLDYVLMNSSSSSQKLIEMLTSVENELNGHVENREQKQPPELIYDIDTRATRKNDSNTLKININEARRLSLITVKKNINTENALKIIRRMTL